MTDDIMHAAGPAATHLVVIPSYNTGAKLFETVAQARAVWATVWVVIDGSTDGTADDLKRAAAADPGLRVFQLPRNQGKGAAVLHGLRLAQAHGFTHALTMDADGQHDPDDIALMMALSADQPEAMVLGLPIFDASAPAVRVAGRRLANLMANIETSWAGIGDSLFGLRVYPIAPLLQVFETTRYGRRFDFDSEAAIRLCWHGVRPVKFPTKVRYFRKDEGGVSHFKYVRDNLLLTFLHARLIAEMVVRRVSGRIG